MRPGIITERVRAAAGQGRAQPISGPFVTCTHRGLSCSSRASQPAVMLAPWQRCSGAGGCPGTLPATGWYRSRVLRGRTRGQTLVPGFLLGRCPRASRGQLERFGGRGSDQPSWPWYHCPAWALKPPHAEQQGGSSLGWGQSPGARGGRCGTEGWGAARERVGWGVLRGTLPGDAGRVCLPSSSLFVPSLPQCQLALAGQ